MAFQFPASPVLGQIFEPTPGTSYKWNGTGWSPYSTLFPGGGTFTGPVLHADGTVSAPGISWANETNSGWYRAGTNDIRLGLGGVVRMQHTTASTWFAGGISALSNGNLVVPGNTTANTLWAGDGTAAAPSIAFSSEPGLGWRRIGAAMMGIAAAGFSVFEVQVTSGYSFAALYPRAVGTSYFSLMSSPSGGNGTQLRLYSNASGCAIESIGQNSGSGTVIQYSAPSHVFNGLVSIDNTNQLAIGNSGGGTVYPNILLRGVGGAKYLRLGQTNGFEVVDQANATLLMSVDNNGNLKASRGFVCHYGTSGGFSGNVFNFYYESGSGTGLWIDATFMGYLGSGSDERIKHDIAPLDALDEAQFHSIRPIRFRFSDRGGLKFDGSDGRWGFSAQNLESIDARLIIGDTNAVQDDGEPKPASIDTNAILAQTVLMVQRLNERVATAFPPLMEQILELDARTRSALGSAPASDVNQLTGALSRVLKLRGVRFQNLDTGQSDIRLDDLALEYPELAKSDSRLTAPIVEALRELNDRLTALERQ